MAKGRTHKKACSFIFAHIVIIKQIWGETMKHESILFLNGSWYHLFLDSLRGLCVNKKIGARFSFFAQILPDAYDDFSAISTESKLYIVCQDMHGALLLITYDGTKWETLKLLDSKSKVAEFKNITLKRIGNFLNLFYVVKTKDAYLLAHQLLGATSGQPKIVDSTFGTEFSVCNLHTSDLMLLYKNSENTLGTRKFRWSKKDFEDFLPLECNCTLEHAVIQAGKGDVLQIAGYATFDKFENILFLTKDMQTEELVISAVHLVSGVTDELTLSTVDQNPTISWCENGLVMSTTTTENNKWSAPRKYIRAATQETVCYHIDAKTEQFVSYGFFQDGKISFYLHRAFVDRLLQENKQKESAFLTRNAAQTHHKPKTEFVPLHIFESEKSAFKELLKAQHRAILEMEKKITVLEQTVLGEEHILEEPEALDRLAFDETTKDAHHK